MRCATILVAVLLSAVLVTACSGGSADAPGITGMAVLNGAPAAGADINVYDTPDRGDTPPLVTVKAGDDGRFSVAIEPGTYFVVVRMNRPAAPPYLSKVPADPVVVAAGVADAGVLELAPESGDAVPPHGTGVSGSVVQDGSPVAGAVVYLYARTDEGLKGPSYTEYGRTGMDGNFEIDARPGSYFVMVRKRFNASASGELRPGDLSGEYLFNPVIVTVGAYTDLGAITVSAIDEEKLRTLRIGISEGAGEAGVRGTAVDESGNPLQGVHVFAYDDYRMMGRPAYKSAKTGPDGRYSISFDRPGRYYIGARDTVGGPMEPGDMAGVYEGSEDNSVELSAGETLKDVDITLREVQ